MTTRKDLILPNDQLSIHFKARELFPQGEKIGEYEFLMSKIFCSTVLDHLRNRLAVPLTVNHGERQKSGWRYHTLDIPGSAGKLSDHMILSKSQGGLSLGAVDIVSSRVSAKDIFLALADLMERKQVTSPREVIYEDNGKSQWLHVSAPERVKNDRSLQLVNLPDKYERGRPPRKGHRLWLLNVGEKRVAVTKYLTPLVQVDG